MSQRLESFLKAAVMCGLGLMLYAKLSDGTLNFYINARFAWLTLVAVVLFIVLALTLAARAASQASAPDAIELAPAKPRFTWSVVALAAIPLALGLLVPARPLGASAVTTRGVGLSAPSAPSGATTLERARNGPKNILDWLREFSRAQDAKSLAGQNVDVVGFVYRDPRAKPDQFWVSRFTVSCCVADASAIGMLVHGDAAAFGIANDQWVRVTGKLDTDTFAGDVVPIIVPDKVEKIDPPSQPYLYP